MTNEEQIHDLLAANARLYDERADILRHRSELEQALARTECSLKAALAELALARAVVDAARCGFGLEAYSGRGHAFDPVDLSRKIDAYDTWRRDANTSNQL